MPLLLLSLILKDEIHVDLTVYRESWVRATPGSAKKGRVKEYCYSYSPGK